MIGSNVVPSFVLDAIGEGVILADPTGVILLANHQAQAVLGRAAEELAGQSLKTLIGKREACTYALELRGYTDDKAGQLVQLQRRLTPAALRRMPFRPVGKAGPAPGDQLLLVVSVCDQAGQDLAEQARLSDRRCKALRAIGQAIRAARAPEVAAQIALRHLKRLLPGAQAVILAFDLKLAQALVLATANEADGAYSGAQRPLDSIDTAATLRRGQPLIIDNTRAAPHAQLARGFMPPAAGSFMCAPLVAGGSLLGAIDLAAGASHFFDERAVAIASEVADQLAIALQSHALLQLVRSNSEQLRALSRQLMGIQENERRHIARELHDEIGQSLTAVKINLETILRLPHTAPFEPHLAESIAIIERVLWQVRAISLDLRPSMLDDLGLESALRWYVRRLAERSGIAVEFVADLAEAHLPTEIGTACFRVTQEALTNVLRHARAQQIRVELRQRGPTLRLSVTDDGIGFDLREAQSRAARGASLGLVGMHERVLLANGELAIESAPGHGTTIRATFVLGTS